MKSTAVLAAVIGSSAVIALEARLENPVLGTSEVVVTRTVTVTTFQQAGPTDGIKFANREVHNTKGHGRKGPSRSHAAASPPERMPSFHGVAPEVPDPTHEAINARSPMPIVVMPTLSAVSSVGLPVAESHKQGPAAPTKYRHGIKPHNGTFNLTHVTNYTAHHGKVKHHNGMVDLKDWIKKVEGTVSDKANDVEKSALTKAQDLLNEVRAEDAAPDS